MRPPHLVARLVASLVCGALTGAVFVGAQVLVPPRWSAGGGGGGTTDHAALSNLAFADSGHTGFVPATRTVNGSALSSDVTITTISGNAGTATALQTARTINGVSFDGTANITLPVASCAKYTITTSGGNWTVNGAGAGAISAATSQSITLWTLPAQGKIQGLTLKHSTAFSGTSISALTVSVGWSGGAAAYSGTTLDIFQAVSNTAMLDQGGHYSATFASHAVTATFTSTGANLTAIAAGSLDVWACTVTLP